MVSIATSLAMPFAIYQAIYTREAITIECRYTLAIFSSIANADHSSRPVELRKYHVSVILP